MSNVYSRFYSILTFENLFEFSITLMDSRLLYNNLKEKNNFLLEL